MGNPEVIWGSFDVTGIDATVRLFAEKMAWDTLVSLTAGQLAVNPITVRPGAVAPDLGGHFAGSQFVPHYRDRAWRNDGGCRTVEEISLEGPVGSIVSVLIDGAELTPIAYRVDNGFQLVRQDGGSWPVRQDMSLPLGQPGTFSVTYYRGHPVDDTVRFLAGILAAEYVKAQTDERGCRLPSGVTSIVRQGVSFEINASMFENGETGIREVDALIHMLNPGKLRSAPRIMTPETLRRRRITTAYSPATTVGLGDTELGTTPLGA